MTKSDYFKSDYFVFNTLLLKKVHSYNLSNDEFILLIYMINFNVCVLDLNNIEKKCYIPKKRALAAFNGLIEKNIAVITTVEDENGLLNEEISLDRFLNDDDKDESSVQDNLLEIMDLYMKASKTELVDEEKVIFQAWNESYDKETIIKAIKEAQYNGLCNLRYIDKLLYEWSNKPKDDIKNDDDVISSSSSKFDFKLDDNWLDE